MLVVTPGAVRGERAGLVAAEYSAAQGNQPVVVEWGRRIAAGVIASLRSRRDTRLKELGVEVRRPQAYAALVTTEWLSRARRET